MKHRILAAMAFTGLLVQGAPASAHIDITSGGTHTGRPGDIKVGPCGGQARGTPHTYRPGETINITIVETIPHPGYFRIAFDDDGEDGFLDPSGTEGTGGNCAGDPSCGPGKADYCNNETVLLDNLSQHASAGLFMRYTFSVTLPNIECTNCTLQILQMMNDFNVHPQAYPGDDLYYACIDLVLSASAPEVNDTPVTNTGMVCDQGGGTGGVGTAGVGGTGGAGGTPVGGTGGVGGVSGTSGGTAGVTAGTTGATGGTGAVGGIAGTAGGTTGAAGAAGMAGAVGGIAGTSAGIGAGGVAAPVRDSGGGSGCSVGAGPAASGNALALLLGLAFRLRAPRPRRRRPLTRSTPA